MSLKWNFYKLGELIDLSTGKLDSNAEEKNGSYPFFTCAPDPLKINSYSFNQKAILLAGNNANGNFHINYYEGKFDAYQRTYVIDVLDKERINLKFLYYALKICLNDFKRMSQGTSTRFLTKKILDNFEIQVPSLKTQLKIVCILDSITNKILNIQKINKNLLSIANNIFKKEFRSFEEYSEENLISSDFGLIPKNWYYKTLDEVSEVAIGKTPPRKEPWWFSEEEGIKWISIKDLGNMGVYVFETSEYLTEETIERFNVKLIPKDPVILSFKLTVGRIGITSQEMVTNEAIAHFKLNENSLITNEYLYLYLNNFNYEELGSTSSIAKAINSKIVKKIPILIPEQNKIEKYQKLFKNIFNEIKNNQLEINNLTILRDTLLPKLMSGEIDVSKINSELPNNYQNITLIIIQYHFKLFIRSDFMKTRIISKIQNQMKPYLNQGQYMKLTNSLLDSLKDIDIIDKGNDLSDFDNFKLLNLFLSAKQVEGCSNKTIQYYESTIEKMLMKIKKHVYNINTDDLRSYLFNHKNEKHSSKTTIDNIRRIFSSFFSWLEDEDYIIKNPVRRIHRVKTGRVVKEVLTDENLEVLRDNCKEIRDLAMVELLISTGIRVGELVRLNIEDIDFYERECVVFGKGESERVVYFDARTKIHLMEYLHSRVDENPALFVSLNNPHTRLGISGVETRLRELGNKCKINNVHPHKFRRTMATNAIDKGMPIEQVQKLLGHVQIDTTMQYAMVNQSNVKLAHRKFIG